MTLPKEILPNLPKIKTKGKHEVKNDKVCVLERPKNNKKKKKDQNAGLILPVSTKKIKVNSISSEKLKNLFETQDEDCGSRLEQMLK